jgi:hypothetical protein
MVSTSCSRSPNSIRGDSSHLTCVFRSLQNGVFQAFWGASRPVSRPGPTRAKRRKHRLGGEAASCGGAGYGAMASFQVSPRIGPPPLTLNPPKITTL